MRADAVGGAEAVTALLAAAADSAVAGGATRVRLFRRHKPDPGALLGLAISRPASRQAMLSASGGCQRRRCGAQHHLGSPCPGMFVRQATYRSAAKQDRLRCYK